MVKRGWGGKRHNVSSKMKNCSESVLRVVRKNFVSVAGSTKKFHIAQKRCWVSVKGAWCRDAFELRISSFTRKPTVPMRHVWKTMNQKKSVIVTTIPIIADCSTSMMTPLTAV